MPSLKWDNSYSVRVKIIDEQHQQLFQHLNELFSAVEEKRDQEVLGMIIDKLLDYVVFHFSTEEKYFDEFNYEKKEEHKKSHQVYINKIKKYQKIHKEKHKFFSNKSFLSLEVIDFLESWILEHIKVSDKEYSKCFRENGLE